MRRNRYLGRACKYCAPYPQTIIDEIIGTDRFNVRTDGKTGCNRKIETDGEACNIEIANKITFDALKRAGHCCTIYLLCNVQCCGNGRGENFFFHIVSIHWFGTMREH